MRGRTIARRRTRPQVTYIHHIANYPRKICDCVVHFSRGNHSAHFLRNDLACSDGASPRKSVCAQRLSLEIRSLFIWQTNFNYWLIYSIFGTLPYFLGKRGALSGLSPRSFPFGKFLARQGKLEEHTRTMGNSCCSTILGPCDQNPSASLRWVLEGIEP